MPWDVGRRAECEQAAAWESGRPATSHEVAVLRTRAWEAAAETRRQTRNGRVGSIFICNLRASAQCRLLPSRAFKRLTSREPTHRNAWDAEHIEYSCGGPDVRPPGAWR